METTLHRQLKQLYAPPGARQEVAVGGYRIDVVDGRRLIEIQHGSLAAIRDKVRRLVQKHDVLVVKPIVVRKTLLRFAAPDGPLLASRMSPKRGSLLDVFDDLVYFTRVFPHRRLTLELLPVEIEEHRIPSHGRRRRWRRKDQVALDQRLISAGSTVRLAKACDLITLLGIELPNRFHTGHLAEQLGITRWFAQRIAYCLRETGAVRSVAKERNALIYELARPGAGRRKRAA